MKIDGIILAAGKSSRMKKNKLLLPLGGEVVIRSVVKAVLESQVNDIIVVTGRDAEILESELMGLDVACVFNTNYEMGQSTSVKKGLEALKPSSDGVLFFMGDQPLVEAKIIDEMIEAFKKSKSSILVPRTREGRGNPVLFSKKWYEHLKDVSGDQGGRQLLKQHQEEILYFDIEDPMFFYDIDDLEKYDFLKSYLEKHQPFRKP